MTHSIGIRRILRHGLLSASTFLLTGAAGLLTSAAGAAQPPVPAFVNGPVVVKTYDPASGSDLLTGGLGASGLAAPAAPAFADPLRPTAEELRRNAIHSNYRALVDTAPGGGYGTLYGPHVAPPPFAGPDGRIFGTEYLAFAKGEGGDQNVTLMVQIPNGFDAARPCIVTAPSSGSRGIYGAIGTAGEWGLKKGCAVAYTDKDTGVGAHNLQADTVNLLRGERANADAAGPASNFTADVTDAERAAFNAAFPNRWAFKHAHSEANPERDWGRHVLLSIDFAFWALETQLGGQGRGPRFVPLNTLVIGSSVSNGGGASLRAAEQASAGLFDGIAVSEPNVNPVYDGRFTIRQGAKPPVVRHSRPLYDYVTLIDVYQGCANQLQGAAAPLNSLVGPLALNRCQSLKDKGLLQSSNPADWPAEAQAIINDYGILPEQNIVQPSHWTLYVPQGIAVTYANAYGRFSVLDNLCGYSFAATDGSGRPVALAPAAEAALFVTANGIPPTGGVNVVNNLSPGGALRDPISLSPSTSRLDQNLDGALCLRNLATGAGTPPGAAARVRQGIREILANGRLGGVPTLVVHGRSDAVLAPNHTSRPYFALSRLQDGRRSRIFYYEVTNAQHLDTLNGLPGFADKFVPLHHYFIQALDLLWAHLTRNAPLPESQVVRTVPRGVQGGVVPPIGPANVPPIVPVPASTDRILFDGATLAVPD